MDCASHFQGGNRAVPLLVDRELASGSTDLRVLGHVLKLVATEAPQEPEPDDEAWQRLQPLILDFFNQRFEFRSDGLFKNQAELPQDRLAGTYTYLPKCPIAGYEQLWKRKRDQRLVQLMRLELKRADIQNLNSATTFFQCTLCFENAIQYPRILVHHCLPVVSAEDIAWHSSHGITSEYPEQVQNLLRMFQEQPWNYDMRQIQFSREAYTEARDIICTTGDEYRDPDAIPAKDMHNSPHLFECRICASDRGRLVMKYIQAVHHALLHRAKDERAIWGCLALTTEQQRIVAEAEARTYKKALKAWDKRDFVCTYCKSRGTFRETYEHIKSRCTQRCNPDSPGLRDGRPVEISEYYLDLDSSFLPPPFRVRI